MTDYTYDEKRPDRLTMYNGESFSYDLIGNPVTYRDKSLAWEKGRQLKRYDGYIFGYDGYGKRISKGSTFYGYVGDRLVEERTGDNVLEYMYDETGVRSIVNNGASYYCIKNLQGDVISLIDTTGEIVVKYTYDAWGNHIATGSDGTVIYHSARGVIDGYENHIGNINPIRYRGYYYDTETGLYYCQSRYYDPEVGRWLNADDINYLDPESLNGLNLYAYCRNNPVMFYDPDGHFPILIALILGGFALAGGITGGVISYNNAVSTGKTGSDLFWSTVGGAFIGASAGLAVGGLVVATGGAIYGAIHGISAIVPFLGLSALKTFALGALAFNQFAFISAPILGITMDGIETVPDGDKTTVPKPGETPRHPYGKIGLPWMIPNILDYFKSRKHKKLNGMFY